MEATNPALDLEIEDRTFYEAIDAVAEKAGIDDHARSPATARSAWWPAPASPQPGMPAMIKPMITLSRGRIRIEFKQLVRRPRFQRRLGDGHRHSSRSSGSPGSGRCCWR